jgi:S-adenosylmethionine decarboxylase
LGSHWLFGTPWGSCLEFLVTLFGLGSLSLGVEWLVDAHGCTPDALRSPAALGAVFDRLVRELDLHPAGDPVWRSFPGEGGVTGLLLLTESHLTCHTFPEHGFAGFNLYCCQPRPDWPWSERLGEALGASRVRVTTHPRGER